MRVAFGRPACTTVRGSVSLGYLQPETYVEEMALLMSMARQLDVEVVQLQPPYHGRRTPRGARFGGEFYWTADLVRSIEALRQNLLDARTLLGWLQTEDPRPVGVMGLSLGGALTLALTCLDARFAFSIPLIAHMDLAAMVADAPVLRGMRHELRQFGWGIDEFRRFVRDIGWYDLAPTLPPGRIYMFAASDDRFFDPAIVEEMWRRWGGRRSVGTPEVTWASSCACPTRSRKRGASSTSISLALTSVDGIVIQLRDGHRVPANFRARRAPLSELRARAGRACVRAAEGASIEPRVGRTPVFIPPGRKCRSHEPASCTWTHWYVRCRELVPFQLMIVEAFIETRREGWHRHPWPAALGVFSCVEAFLRTLHRQAARRRPRRSVLLVGRDRALGDPPLVDLVGAVREARPARLQRHARERRVERVAERAVHLDRAVDDAVQGVRDEVLRHRHLAPEVLAAVDLVGGVQDHELPLVELHRRVGDHPLDALLVGEQRSVRVAR